MTKLTELNRLQDKIQQLKAFSLKKENILKEKAVKLQNEIKAKNDAL